jgi:excisionase family DNA binding protein
MTTHDELITVGEAARIAGVSTQRIYELAAAGRLGRRVVDRYWLFTREEVAAYRDAPKDTGGRPPKNKPRLRLVKT